MKSRNVGFILTVLLLSMLLSSCKQQSGNGSVTPDPTVVINPEISNEESTEQKIAKIEASEEVKRALLSIGNNNRMKQVIDKISKGEETTIAYLGGSITEGYKVNSVQNYAAKTTKLIKEMFGNDKIKTINAGLSGTSSTIGLLRLKEDVLDKKPDLIVIEFAVNDGNDTTSKMAYESLVKECLLSETKPAVLLIFTVLENGYTCQDHMKEIGEMYQLPMISVANAIQPEIKNGTMTWSDYALDEAHPNNNGHTKIASYIEYYLKTVVATNETNEAMEYTSLKQFGTPYTGLTFYTKDNLYPENLGGFVEGGSGINHFGNGWTWSKEDKGSMKFTMEGKDLILLYKEDNNVNLATLEVYIDGKLSQKVRANSSKGWNNPQTIFLLNEVISDTHEVELKIADDDIKKVFGILGFGTTGTIHSIEKLTDEQIPYTQRAILAEGNNYRLHTLMERAQKGEELTIGFIGGSITMGSGASDANKCYAKLVYDWWVENFPQATFHFVNAGIGATTSQFACARLDSDLLDMRPDFVITEFSVNDEGTQKFGETYESLIREILLSEREPAVLVLNMVQYDSGYNVQNRHNAVANAYDLPIISMKESIYKEIQYGKLVATDVSADMLHPNDRGHAYAAEIVTNYLNLVKTGVLKYDTSYEVPETNSNLISMNSVRYDNRNSSPVLNGFVADTVVQNNITEVFRNGYTAKEVGNSITFTVEGSQIALQYMKTNLLGAPLAVAIIDGDEDHAIALDGNYPNGWGNWLYMHDIATNLDDGTHTLEIRITQAGTKPFYLVSVITK